MDQMANGSRMQDTPARADALLKEPVYRPPAKTKSGLVKARIVPGIRKHSAGPTSALTTRKGQEISRLIASVIATNAKKKATRGIALPIETERATE